MANKQITWIVRQKKTNRSNEMEKCLSLLGEVRTCRVSPLSHLTSKDA